MDGTHSMHRADEKCISILARKPERRRPLRKYEGPDSSTSGNGPLGGLVKALTNFRFLQKEQSSLAQFLL